MKYGKLRGTDLMVSQYVLGTGDYAMCQRISLAIC